MAGSDVDDGQIVGHVGADKPRVEPPAVRQRHQQLGRRAHYVRIGDDMALGIEDDAAAQTAVGLDLDHLRLSLPHHGHELLLDRCRG